MEDRVAQSSTVRQPRCIAETMWRTWRYTNSKRDN